MQSRTPEGKHTKRFVVLVKADDGQGYTRSVSIPEFFPTKEDAQAAVSTRGFSSVVYKIRQK